MTEHFSTSFSGFPPLARRVDDWDPAFAAHLSSLGPFGLACGDLNVAFADADFYNPHERRMELAAGTTPQERASFGRHLVSGAGFGVDAFRHIHGPAAKGVYTYWSARAKNR